MAHTHSNATVSTSTVTHKHSKASLAVVCFLTYPNHLHYVDLLASGSHAHSACVFSFASAELGTPWWNHVHAVALVSEDSQGASHSHNINSPTNETDYDAGYCDQDGCDYLRTHGHTFTNTASNSNTFAHTHTIISFNSGTADPAGTPESHVHAFNGSLWILQGGGHTHTVAITFNNALCYLSKNHNHAVSGSSGTKLHNHDVSGNSGSGGESAALKQVIMDGLVFAE